MANVPFTRSHASQHAADLIGWFLGLSADTAGRVTDMNAGANVRTFFESIALRLEALDNGIFLGLRRAIPQVLYEFFGEGDGIVSTVGFPSLPALPASGVVRFTRTVGTTLPITVPIGTRFDVPTLPGARPKRYTVVVPLTLATGQTAGDTLVRAATAGTIGNASAQTLRLVDTIANVATATNPIALLNGTEVETEEARRIRFTQYLRNLARAEHGGLEVGALSAQLVTAGSVVERVLFARSTNVPDKRGLVDVFIDNGGASASATLIGEAQRIIDGARATDGTRIPGYKAAGEVVRVQAVTPQAVSVTAAIALDPGFAFAPVQAATQAAIEAHVFDVGVFADLVLADLICAIASVRGVADVQITTPTANVTAARGARILPGPVTITAMAA